MSFQTIIALVVVALAVAYLVRSVLKKRPASGCGSEGCSAVSPEVKKFRDRLKR